MHSCIRIHTLDTHVFKYVAFVGMTSLSLERPMGQKDMKPQIAHLTDIVETLHKLPLLQR